MSQWQFPRECNVRFVEKDGVRIGSGSFKKYDNETAYLKYMYIEPSTDYDCTLAYQELYKVLENDILHDGFSKILVMVDDTSDLEILQTNDFVEVEDIFDRELIIKLTGAQVNYTKAFVKKIN